jgi:hypothetical protein
MQVVCEATQNNSVAVQVGAFECLVRIMGLYYDKMGLYMEQALFGASCSTVDRDQLLTIIVANRCGDETSRRESRSPSS